MSSGDIFQFDQTEQWINHQAAITAGEVPSPEIPVPLYSSTAATDASGTKTENCIVSGETESASGDWHVPPVSNSHPATAASASSANPNAGQRVIDVFSYCKENEARYKLFDTRPCAYCGIEVHGATIRLLDGERCCKCCLQHYVDHKPFCDPHTCECRLHCAADSRLFVPKPPNRALRRQQDQERKKAMRRTAKRDGLHLGGNM